LIFITKLCILCNFYYAVEYISNLCKFYIKSYTNIIEDCIIKGIIIEEYINIIIIIINYNLNKFRYFSSYQNAAFVYNSSRNKLPCCERMERFLILHNDIVSFQDEEIGKGKS